MTARPEALGWAAAASNFGYTLGTANSFVQWVRLVAKSTGTAAGATELAIAVEDAAAISGVAVAARHRVRPDHAVAPAAGAPTVAWAATIPINTTNNACSTQNFDIAYEQVTGRIIVCWEDSGNDQTTNYDRWTGCAWAGPNTTINWTIANNNRCTWMEMASQPRTNNIVMACWTNGANSRSSGVVM